MVTTIFWRRAMVLAVLVSAVGGTAQAQEVSAASSIASRLKSVEYIGIFLERDGVSVSIYVYSSAEHAKNLEAQKQDEDVAAKYQKSFAEIEGRLKIELNKRSRNDVEIAALNKELTDLQNATPKAKLDRRLRLQRVVSVGTDYIEYEAINNPGRTTLVPFHRVSRFYTNKPGTTKAPESPKTD